jgi:hypothetical protein
MEKKDVKKISIALLLVLPFLLSACELPFLGGETTNVETQIAQTVAAGETATAVVLQAKQEIFDGQTATAAVQKAVSDALTAAAPPPTDTLVPSDTPTFTPEASNTPEVSNTPTDTPLPPTETPTETPVPSPTIKASATQCFVVITDWCLSHEGCATMTIINKTTSTAKVRFWVPKGDVDTTFYPPPGRCTFMIRPGKYNYSFDYCGQHSEGSHALNDKWYINFQCP